MPDVIRDIADRIIVETLKKSRSDGPVDGNAFLLEEGLELLVSLKKIENPKIRRMVKELVDAIVNVQGATEH